MNEMWRFWGLVLLVIIMMATISIILMKIFKKNKLISLIPAFLLLLVSISTFIKGRFFSCSLQDLGYYVMSMITFLASLVTLIIPLAIMKMKRSHHIGDIN